jgi:eukaryotic-like serine/threonine-protein kinase
MESSAAPQQPLKIAVGDGGRYVLKACLSRSAAASVYAAFDVRLSREVVVKVLKTSRDGTEAHAVAHAADLLASVRLMARLEHPSMVTLFDAGLCGMDAYIAMERLEGSSLHERLAAGWRPTPQEALQVGAGIAAALAFVHEAGLLHGRIEPAHVFLLEPLRLKLLSCGSLGPGGRIDTPPVDALGEPSQRAVSAHTAPEVLLGVAWDARCDVYGVGLLLYEMLAGRAAFCGESAQALRNAVLLSDVPEVRTLNPGVPPLLSAAVARAMARDPALRQQSMRELLQALNAALAITSGTERKAGPGRRRRQAAAACAGLLLAGGAVGFFVWRERPLPTSMVEPAPVVARNMVPAAQDPPAPVQSASSAMRADGEGVAPNVTSSATRPLERIREAAAAGDTRARAKPPVPPPAPAPKTATAPTRPPTPRPVAPTAARTADPAPTTPVTVQPAEAQSAAARPAESAASPALPADAANSTAASARGAVVFAVEPGGTVEINGVKIGTTPPLRRLTLPNGKYEITIRNEAFQPHVVNITVGADKPVNISHRFGS